MSFSVDDLVSSLSSNCISNETAELNAWKVRFSAPFLCFSVPTDTSPQAQFAQALYFQPAVAAPSARTDAHANTPMACTPTSSAAWDQPEFHRRRHNSVAGMGGRHDADERSSYGSADPMAMEEDEQMVEDMLFPSSPASASAPQMPPPSPTYYARHPRKTSVSAPYYEMPSGPSLFATTDPFYLAELARPQNPAPASFFAQFGKPTQQSAFLKGSQFAHGAAFAHSSEMQATTAFVR